MASEKNITMRQYNGVDYDTLYPKTIASQVEGVYSKDEVISNETKMTFGVDADSTPNNIFQLLSRFQNGLGNEHIWGKYIESGTWTYFEVSSGLAITNSNISDYTWGKSITQNTEDGSFIIGDVFTPSTINNIGTSYPYYAKNNTTADIYRLTGRSSTSSTQISFIGYRIYPKLIDIKISEDFYNNNTGILPSGKNDYNYYGRLGEFAKCYRTSYIGLGLNGSSTPNTLYLPFTPFLIIIGSKITNSSTQLSSCCFLPTTMFNDTSFVNYYHNFSISSSTYATYDTNNKLLTWYSNNVTTQMNVSDTEYYVYALG